MITINLPDKYEGQIADVEVKTSVLVKGKKVLRYVDINSVVLNKTATATFKPQIAIKAGNIIRVSIGGVTIKYITVK